MPDAILRKDAHLPDALERFLDGLGLLVPREQRAGEADDHEEPPLHGRILLAEDSPTNAALLGRILHVAGADVTCVENGAQALLAMDQGRFDLVLMDIEMPLMDGRVATRMLRASGVPCPIVALTGHDALEFGARPDAACFDAVLGKPIRPSELVAACRAHLARARVAR
ncbi:MAG: response regulator [Planctomycetes bacterium]|nr:response regulator [Planctomycetota bacterium]